jgi:hypothetical protein
MRFRSATVLGTFAFAALVALGVPGATGAVTSVTGSATPATNLLDGETISVSGVGFDPNAQVGIAECLTGATEPGQCDLTGVSFTTTDGSGSFSIEFNVTRFINVGGAITDCAALNSCVLGMEETANTSLSVTVGVSFENIPVVPPTVQVNPSANLIDRQSVQVEGTGFTPRASIALVECESGSTAISDCDLSTILIVTADPSGNMESTYQVARVINVNGSSLDCAAPTGCALGAGNVDDYLQRSVVPISFANAPVPRPAVTVIPSTNLLDGQAVTVTGSGFSAYATISVSECRSGATGPTDCAVETDQLTTADASGSISTTYKVAQDIQVASTSVDCLVPGACELEVVNVNDLQQGSVVPIAFELQASGVSSPGPNPTRQVGSLAMTGYSPWSFFRIGSGLVIAGLAMLSAPRLRRSRGVRPQTATGIGVRGGGRPGASG